MSTLNICLTGIQLGLRGSSVLVVSLAPNGPAQKCGKIMKFDQILEINGDRVASDLEKVFQMHQVTFLYAFLNPTENRCICRSQSSYEDLKAVHFLLSFQG